MLSIWAECTPKPSEAALISGPSASTMPFHSRQYCSRTLSGTSRYSPSRAPRQGGGVVSARTRHTDRRQQRMHGPGLEHAAVQGTPQPLCGTQDRAGMAGRRGWADLAWRGRLSSVVDIAAPWSSSISCGRAGCSGCARTRTLPGWGSQCTHPWMKTISQKSRLRLAATWRGSSPSRPWITPRSETGVPGS
jgi:hypothetical protein